MHRRASPRLRGAELWAPARPRSPLLLLATPILSMSSDEAHKLIERVNFWVQLPSFALCAWLCVSSVVHRPRAHLALVYVAAIESLYLLSCAMSGSVASPTASRTDLSAVLVDVLHWMAEGARSFSNARATANAVCRRTG